MGKHSGKSVWHFMWRTVWLYTILWNKTMTRGHLKHHPTHRGIAYIEYTFIGDGLSHWIYNTGYWQSCTSIYIILSTFLRNPSWNRGHTPNIHLIEFGIFKLGCFILTHWPQEDGRWTPSRKEGTSAFLCVWGNVSSYGWVKNFLGVKKTIQNGN